MSFSRDHDKKQLAKVVAGTSIAAGVVGNLNILGWLKIMQTKKPALIVGSGIAATGLFAASSLALFRAQPTTHNAVKSFDKSKENGMPFIACKFGLSS